MHTVRHIISRSTYCTAHRDCAQGLRVLYVQSRMSGRFRTPVALLYVLYCTAAAASQQPGSALQRSTCAAFTGAWHANFAPGRVITRIVPLYHARHSPRAALGRLAANRIATTPDVKHSQVQYGLVFMTPHSRIRKHDYAHSRVSSNCK